MGTLGERNGRGIRACDLPLCVTTPGAPPLALRVALVARQVAHRRCDVVHTMLAYTVLSVLTARQKGLMIFTSL